MRIRLAVLAPVIAAVALLGACSNDEEPGPSDTERNAYLTAVNAAGVTFPDDDAAVSAGQQACEDLASGKSMNEASENVEGQRGTDAYAVVVAAVGALCRDQFSKSLPTFPEGSDLPSLPDLGN